MMTRMAAVPALAGIALALCLAACFDRVAGGGATEETNGSLAGTVIGPDGKAVAGASVFIRGENFLPDTSLAGDAGRVPDAITDAAGRFRKDSLEPGAYTVEFQDENRLAAQGSGKVTPGAVAELGKTALAPGGSLEGSLELVPGAGPAYIRFFGLTRVARTDSLGHFLVRDLPPGPVRPDFVAPLPEFRYPTMAVRTVATGDTAKLGAVSFQAAAEGDFSQWSSSRRIYLNTAAAGIPDTLTGYPLLVRLDAKSFDFTRGDSAGISDGKDLRFASERGKPLAFEIERWDAAGGHAEIWVRLDTLWGGAGDHYITQYWGNPRALPYSRGITVFAEYGAAWHMRAGDSTADGRAFPDASPTGAHLRGYARAETDSGGIGPSAAFSGGSLAAPGKPALKPAGGLTLSAWVNGRIADTTEGEIATMGDSYGFRLLADGNLSFYLFADSVASPPKGNWITKRTTKLNLRDGHWHHAAAAWDGKLVRFYADGVAKDSMALTNVPAYVLDKDFRIGTHSDPTRGFQLNGHLDEIRMSPAALTAARIRADYQSQRAGSPLLDPR